MDRPFHLEIEAGDDAAAAAGAEALVAAGQLPDKEMLAAFRRALQLDPADPDYHYILGSALMRLGRHGEAVTAFREALTLQPGDATYRRALGAALWRVGRHAEAGDAFQQVLHQQPRDVDALNGLGLAQLRLGDLRRALDALGRAHSLDRERPDVRSNYAAALWSSGKTAQAERHFRLAVEKSPAYLPFQLNLGHALVGLGRPVEAALRFREALRYAPEDARVLFDLGDACFAAGRADEAEAAWERGALLDPALAARRTGSHEARRTLAMQRLKDELAEEKGRLGSGGPAAALLGAVDAVGESVRDAVKGRGGLSRRLASLAVAGLVLLGLRASLVVVPHYVAHLQLRDEVARACRTATKDDSVVHERVMSAVREHGREPFVLPSAIQIERNGRLRRVEFSYVVPLEILPGWRPSVRFRVRVEESVLVAPDPVFL